MNGRRGGQLAIPQYIQATHKNAVFAASHHSSDAGEVQHLKDSIRHAIQFGDKIVFCVKPAEGSIVCGIHYMVTVCFCTDRQIPQILQRNDAAVGIYFSLHLHGKQPLKGSFLHLVQRRQQRGKVVELVETDVQPIQMGSEIRKGIVVFNLHVQDVICLKAYLVQRVPQFPQ